MSNITEALQRFEQFSKELPQTVIGTMDEYRHNVEDYIQEQLMTGVNGEEKPLRPTYSGDPYFNSDEAGQWKGKGDAYARWKKKITPPATSYLGLPSRDSDTPNLIITGEFYSSITAAKFDKGLRIEAKGTPMSADIERKYGSVILKPGRHAVNYFIKYALSGKLKTLYQKYGL